jgi:hypothetical protein
MGQNPADTAMPDTYVDITEAPRMLDTISKFLVYPTAAKENNLEGRVVFL